MMNFEEILPIILKTPPEGELKISRLIREIVIQDQKIKNSDQQSFYFKKALPSQIQKLQELKNEYHRLRALFYQVNIENYEDLLNETEKLDTKNYPLFIKKMLEANKNAKKQEIEDILIAKEKYNELQEIDFYLENPEELIKFFELYE